MIYTIDQLTEAQRDAWAATRTALLMQGPFWSHLLYTFMTGEDGEQAIYTDEVGTAAVDDKHVFINPTDFLSRPLGNRVFILAHEICHAMYGHAILLHRASAAGFIMVGDGVRLPFDERTFQMSGDYVVNDLLLGSGIGTPPPDTLHDKRYTSSMSLLDVYKLVYEDQKKQKEKNKPDGQDGDESGDSPGFDKVMQPGTGDGKSPAQATHERNDKQWENEIEAAAAAAEMMGQMPASLKEALGRLTSPALDWRELMRASLDRKSGGHAYDWRVPDRRMITRPDMIIAPARKGSKTGMVVVIGDSSGSVGADLCCHMLSHMASMIDDLEPERVVFAWCDTRTHGWEEVESLADVEAIKNAGVKGRGGTDFRKPFAEVEEMGETPAVLIYMTDGYGVFPKDEPGYQVIWADVSGKRNLYPWGDYVHIPLKG